MAGRVVVITGTGTDVGKTHLTVALLRLWSSRARVTSFKPIESGVDGSGDSDSARLAPHATFHVKPVYAFVPPISPHLAARLVGVTIDFAPILTVVQRARVSSDAVVVELAGGLFTPLGEATTNADLIARLAPDVTVLVAPNRLGVLHDVGAVLRAAKLEHLRVDVLALNTAASEDASSSTNPEELRRLAALPVVGPFGRFKVESIANDERFSHLLRIVAG